LPPDSRGLFSPYLLAMRGPDEQSTDEYLNGRQPKLGQIPLPPELAKPTIKDRRQINLIDAIREAKKKCP
jgi:hypothetical protein